MNALIFRKIVHEGVNYYQFIDYLSNFENDGTYGEYKDRFDCDYFYIDEDSDIIVPNMATYKIYYDGEDGTLQELKDSKLYSEMVYGAKNVAQYFDDDPKIVEIINNIKSKVKFQDDCIDTLVYQIFLNQKIIDSDFTPEEKYEQKSNIILHGPVGSGKRTIIDTLKESLDIPYADVTVGPDIMETAKDIGTQLLAGGRTNEEAGRGIVFIQDNYDSLFDQMGDGIYNHFNQLTTLGAISYQNGLLDLRNVTYVVLFDEDTYTTQEDVDHFMDAANCDTSARTKALSLGNIYDILHSPCGRLYHYSEFLNKCHKQLIVDENALIELIYEVLSCGLNINTVNLMVATIYKNGLSHGIKDVYIDPKTISEVHSIIDGYIAEYKKRNCKNDYWFEELVEGLFNEAKRYVVGQDKALKTMIHTLAQNVSNSTNDLIENPKGFIKSILIKGDSDSGKTTLVKTLLQLFKVPSYEVKSTKYKESIYLSDRVSDIVSDMLRGLLKAADGDLDRAETGILFIDNIDKKANPVDEDTPLQDAVSAILEGGKFEVYLSDDVKVPPTIIDTSRISVIMTGSFDKTKLYKGIVDIHNERTGENKMGYTNKEPNNNPVIEEEDYFAYGMKQELMHSIDQVIELEKITREKLIEIMKKSFLSPLEIEKFMLDQQGIEAVYEDSFYEKIADTILAKKRGLSEINKLFNKVLMDINIEDIHASEIEKIIFTGEVLENPEKIQLVKRGKRKKKTKE